MIGDFKKQAFLDGIIFTRQTIRERQLDAIQKSREDLNKALLVSRQKGENIGDINVIMALSESDRAKKSWKNCWRFFSWFKIFFKNNFSRWRSVFIPKNPNTINVLGEVLNPIAFEYTKEINIRSAISNAGGYQDYADKRKVYVIKANGMIEKANRNIFVKNVDLEPGDTIIVPRKIITNNPGIDALFPLHRFFQILHFLPLH